ncbi:MAG: glycosyltransferase family 2 protein [Proteobacteria bacterium]|nr:glycosyltransferase family 2 protein [Pseudomonadota bacterium]
MLEAITPVLLTYNEEPNLARSLAPLAWARRVVVVDSGSQDETKAIAARHTNVTLVERPFDNHTAQWNFGVDQVQTDWVLSLDADYVLTEDLVRELGALTLGDGPVAYFARFRICVNGQPLRRSLYPPRAVLFHRRHCRYVPDGHTQLLQITGPSAPLAGFIHHDDRKPLARWLWAQSRYTDLEAEKLTKAKPGGLPLQDRLRQMIFIAPPLVLFYTLFVRGVILDGWPGLHYAFQRTLAELLLSLKLIELKLAGRSGGGS